MALPQIGMGAPQIRNIQQYLAQLKATGGVNTQNKMNQLMQGVMGPAYRRSLGLHEAGARRAIEEKRLQQQASIARERIGLGREELGLRRQQFTWQNAQAQQQLAMQRKQMKQAGRAATIGGIVDIGMTAGWLKYSGLLDNIWGGLG